MRFRNSRLRIGITALPPPGAPRAAGRHAQDGDPSARPGHATARPGAHGGHPEPTRPEDQPPVSEIPTTPSGLPVRVPQTNLADPLLADDAAEAAAEAAGPQTPDDPGRPPAEIRRIMGSYQRGSRRGRTEAAEAVGVDAAGTPGDAAAEGEEGQ